MLAPAASKIVYEIFFKRSWEIVGKAESVIDMLDFSLKLGKRNAAGRVSRSQNRLDATYLSRLRQLSERLALFLGFHSQIGV